MGIENGFGIENAEISVALFLMLINVLIFVDRRNGMSMAKRGARGFAVAAFASAVVMLMVLNHLMVQVWIHPGEETSLMVFQTAMIGMSLATSGALAFWILSRWNV